MTPDDTTKQENIPQEPVLKEEPKKYIDIPFYPILKVDKLYAAFPIDTSVPTDNDIEGKLKLYNYGATNRLYAMINGVWTNLTVSDHAYLTGLTADDHTQYILVNGTRAFTGVVSGIEPTANANLTTKLYVDGKVIDFAWQGGKLDGLTETTATSGTITRYQGITSFYVSSTNGSSAKLTSSDFGLGGYTGGVPSFEVSFYMKLSAITRQNVFIGLSAGSAYGEMPVNGILTTDHIGFIVDDDTLYASQGNGSQQNTNTAGTPTLTNWNLYKIVFNYTGSCRFYVNGVNVRDLPIYKPDTSDALLLIGINSAGTEEKYMSILHPYYVKIILS